MGVFAGSLPNNPIQKNLYCGTKSFAINGNPLWTHASCSSQVSGTSQMHPAPVQTIDANQSIKPQFPIKGADLNSCKRPCAGSSSSRRAADFCKRSAEAIGKANGKLPDATLLVISALAGSNRFSNNSERLPFSSMCTNPDGRIHWSPTDVGGLQRRGPTDTRRYFSII